MENLVLLRPYAFTLAFVFLALSVLAGLLGAYFGDGIKFGNKKLEVEPKTTLGKHLRKVEWFSLRFAIFMVLFAIGTGFLSPPS